MMPVACDVHKFRFWPSSGLSGTGLNTRFTSAICAGAEPGLLDPLISEIDPVRFPAEEISSDKTKFTLSFTQGIAAMSG